MSSNMSSNSVCHPRFVVSSYGALFVWYVFLCSVC